MAEEKQANTPDPSNNAGKDSDADRASEKARDAQGDRIDIRANRMNGNAFGDNGRVFNFGASIDEIIKLQRESRREDREFLKEMARIFSSQGNNGSANSTTQTDSLFQKLEYEREQVHAEYKEESAAASIDDTWELPETPGELEKWYTRLTDYQRCFVQTVTILYGVPFIDVAQHAEGMSQSSSQKATQSTDATQPSSHPGRQSRHELLEATHTTTRRVNHVERIFWHSGDVQKQQTFTLRVLRFLSEEYALSYGGPRLSDTVRNWAEELKGECSRKAAYALGIILYYQSADELWRLANTWANSDNAREWRLAASALNGAYDAERYEDEQLANDTRKSPILRLLNQWVERARNARNPEVGCTAAITYGFISRKAPAIALAGLENLLCLPGSKVGDSWESISVSVWNESVSNYVGIAWEGNIRKVLESLAKDAETLTYQRQLPQKTDERILYRERCKLNLKAVFDIFFLLALSSWLESSDDKETAYSLTDELAAQPYIVDDKGRDVILAGILSQEEFHWRNYITVLLCADIFAGRAKEALFLMRLWAETVLQNTCANQEELEAEYVQFVAGVGKQVQYWYDDLVKMHLNPLPALRTFIFNLKLWQNKRQQRPINDFVEKVLSELNAQ